LACCTRTGYNKKKKNICNGGRVKGEERPAQIFRLYRELLTTDELKMKKYTEVDRNYDV